MNLITASQLLYIFLGILSPYTRYPTWPWVLGMNTSSVSNDNALSPDWMNTYDLWSGVLLQSVIRRLWLGEARPVNGWSRCTTHPTKQTSPPYTVLFFSKSWIKTVRHCALLCSSWPELACSREAGMGATGCLLLSYSLIARSKCHSGSRCGSQQC